MESWPIINIFHRLRPYLCSKQVTLGFYKQATHRRPGDEPVFYFGVHCSWLGMAQKWSILDQKWPNMAGLSTLQSGPKGTKSKKSYLWDGGVWGPAAKYMNQFMQLCSTVYIETGKHIVIEDSVCWAIYSLSPNFRYLLNPLHPLPSIIHILCDIR